MMLTLMTPQNRFFQSRNPLLYVFAVCFLYWAYVFCTSRMTIETDAINYQALGTMLHEQGWAEYFKTGPNREPVYPFIISVAMGVAKTLSVPYQPVQKLIQILILFVTQLLTLTVLRKLKINNFITALTVLYLGISPAIVNSAFSLFSEIATYPIVLGIVILSYKSYEAIQKQESGKVLVLGASLGTFFIAGILTKAIFEVVAPFFLILYLLFLIISAFRQNKNMLKAAGIFFITCLLTLQGGMFLYKSANKRYNGNFAVTNRGAWALYGNTARRMQPLTKEKLLTALAYIPGEGVCTALFKEQRCTFWSFKASDVYGHTKRRELAAEGMPPEQIDKTLIKLSAQYILANPFQYALLMAFEAAKMFFWESSKIGFVAYPGWMMGLFYSTLFKNGIRLLLFFLTVSASFYAKVFLWRRRKDIFNTNADNSATVLLLVFILVEAFIWVHAFFFVLTRYILPIAPLYLIMIAFLFQQFFVKQGRVS